MDKLGPPKLAGAAQPSASGETSGSAQALVRAVRNHFEGNNILTSQEFEEMVRLLLEKKPAAEPVRASSARSA